MPRKAKHPCHHPGCPNRICHTMELDEKYASVILRRYVEDTDDADNVYVIRNGEKLMYSDLVKEVDFGDGAAKEDYEK